MSAHLGREWAGIQLFPAATQTKLYDLLGKLKQENVSTLTILVMGKGGVGKSSLVNSIIGERVVPVSAFQAENPRPMMVSRTRAGFTLNIVDTPGLVEGGYVNQQAFDIIKKRSEALLRIVRDGAKFRKKDIRDYKLPVVLVENSERCNKNENDEKILPDGTPWIPNLVETITDVVLSGGKGILFDKKLIDGPNPNARGKMLIPVILAFQYFFVFGQIKKWIADDMSREVLPPWA